MLRGDPTRMTGVIRGRLPASVCLIGLTLWGLALTAAMLPILGRVWSFESDIGLYVAEAAAMALMVTPSLAYMAEAKRQRTSQCPRSASRAIE